MDISSDSSGGSRANTMVARQRRRGDGGLREQRQEAFGFRGDKTSVQGRRVGIHPGAQCLTGKRAGVLSVSHDLGAIHEHVVDAQSVGVHPRLTAW